MFSPTLKKKFLWHPGYESSNFPQNLTNARVLISTSSDHCLDHCLDHFESLEFAQAQLREKSHFTSLFSSQSAVFALCRLRWRPILSSMRNLPRPFAFIPVSTTNRRKISRRRIRKSFAGKMLLFSLPENVPYPAGPLSLRSFSQFTPSSSSA